MTARDVAAVAAKPIDTIYQMARCCRMPRPLRVGRAHCVRRDAAQLRWPVWEVEQWLEDGEGECWGPVRLNPPKVADSIRLGMVSRTGQSVKWPGRNVRFRVTAGVIDPPLDTRGPRDPNPEAEKGLGVRHLAYYSRAGLEKRFRDKVRRSRRPARDWRAPLLLDIHDLASVLIVRDIRTIRKIVEAGKVPASWHDPCIKSPWRAIRWRRDVVERWLADEERRAAEEQMRRADGGLLTMVQVAAAFQMEEAEIEDLETHGLPTCQVRGEKWYRVDLICDWLAEEAERQREETDRMLAPLAFLDVAQVAVALSVCADIVYSIDEDPDSDVVALHGTPAHWQISAKKKKHRNLRFRLHSLQRYAGVEVAPMVQGEVASPDLAAVLGVGHPPDMPSAKKRLKKELFALGRQEPYKAEPHDDIYTVQHWTASDGVKPHDATTSRRMSEVMRKRGFEREWRKLEAGEDGLLPFPRGEKRAGARWYSIAGIADWLDAVEKAPTPPPAATSRAVNRTGSPEAPADPKVCPSCGEGFWRHILSQQTLAQRLDRGKATISGKNEDLAAAGALKDGLYAECTTCGIEFYRTRFSLGVGSGGRRR
ncbi:helix-turn-helix transcriptional regulator [Planctomycetota bacterium]